MLEGIANSFVNSTRAQEVTNEAWVKTIAEMAEKAGIPAPKLYHLKEGQGPFRGPFAAALSKRHIVVNEDILKCFNTSIDSHTIPDELKAILGHEMLHNKHHGWNIASTRLSPLLIPMAALGGYWLFEQARKKSKNPDDPKEFHAKLDEAISEERKALKKLAEEDDTSLGNALLTTAKYGAVAIAGLGAGLFAARQFSRAFEFAADAHGAKLVNPEAMANGLKKLHVEMDKVMDSMGGHEKMSATMKLINETIGAHPSLEQRLANINRMAGR